MGWKINSHTIGRERQMQWGLSPVTDAAELWHKRPRGRDSGRWFLQRERSDVKWMHLLKYEAGGYNRGDRSCSGGVYAVEVPLLKLG